MRTLLAAAALLALAAAPLAALSGEAAVKELTGPWQIKGGAFLDAGAPQWADAQSAALPARWNDLAWPGKPAGRSEGWASYRIWLDLSEDTSWALDWRMAGSAARVVWMGRTVHQAGVLGDGPRLEVPGNRPALVALAPGAGWLVVQASNFHHVDGGLWDPIRLGPQEALQRDLQVQAGVDWFMAGAFIILGLLGLGVMLVLKRERASLWFGLLALTLGVRILFHGSLDILQVFPDIDWEFFNKVRHWTMYLLPFLLLNFLDTLLPGRFPRWLRWTVAGVSGAGAALVLATPYAWFGQAFYAFAPIVLAEIAVSLWAMVRSVRRDNPVAIAAIVGATVMILANVVEMVHYLTMSPMPNLVPPATLFMLFCLALALGLHLARTQVDHESLNRQYSGIKNSLERFIPPEFLSLMHRESLAELELGMAVSAEMAVLFADVRSFSSLTQDMRPEDIFRMVNSFLGLMGPIIRKHGGFVDKYLGDGIMAVFPSGGASAVQAALRMHASIPGLNAIHRVDELPELSIGVGIHQGALLLGTIGEEARMESTVISSVVNLASRLESLTREYKTPIIVSPNVIMSLPEGSGIEYRFLGHEQIRGFDTPQPIFEIFNPDPINIREQKNSSKADFEDALIHFSKNEFTEAAKILIDLRKRYPDDPAPATYLKRVREIQEKRLIYHIRQRQIRGADGAPAAGAGEAAGDVD